MNLTKLHNSFQWISITAFFFIICAPGIWMLCGHKTVFSYTEKRMLATFPSVPDNAPQIQSFFSGVDDYLNDHFGFREWMVYRYQREIKKRFPDVERISKVMQGQNNWYFFTSNNMLEDFTGKDLRSDDELSEWIETYRSKKKWLTKHGIPYLLIVPPNKMTVYGEFLGEPWISQKGTTRLTQLKSRLQDIDYETFLDLSPALIGKGTDENLFFKSDTHWAPYGAYLGYLAIAEKLETLFPGRHFKRDFIFSNPITRICNKKEDSCGDLTSMLLDYDSFDESYREVEPFALCGDILPVEFELSNLDYSNEEHSFSTRCPQRELKALIFRDSFFSALVPFIAANFKEVIYLWKDYEQQNIEELLATFKPDIIIEEKAERAL